MAPLMNGLSMTPDSTPQLAAQVVGQVVAASLELGRQPAVADQHPVGRYGEARSTHRHTVRGCGCRCDPRLRSTGRLRLDNAVAVS